MTFFATIARAFMEARQRQAERIIRDHYRFMGYDVPMTAATPNVVELARRPAADASFPAEFKQAA
jgi:hypothetical protein